MPESLAVMICSLLAFAVTAMTGTCPRIVPKFCISRIFFVHVSPSITGIYVNYAISSWAADITPDQAPESTYLKVHEHNIQLLATIHAEPGFDEEL